MPGLMLNNPRGGTRSEYLAHFLLATLGVAVKVPREEDIGADFYCSLAKLENGRLTFRGSYIVQVKSTPIAPIRYGGPDKKGVRKDQEIKWLFGQELPLLIGYADKREQALHLYTTSNMWAAFYTSGGPGEVVLEPAPSDTVSYQYEQFTRETVDDWPPNIGDGYRWRVPLGLPITSFTADESEDQDRVQLIRDQLEFFLQLEQTNIGYRQLNIHYSRCPFVKEVWDGGLQMRGIFTSLVGNKTIGANTENQLRSIAPGISTLAFNLKQQGRLEEFMRLRDIAQMIPEGAPERDTLERFFPELFSADEKSG